jgi:hypothetical protein
MELSSADQWFAALDQRHIGDGAHEWVMQVLGVVTQDDQLWVQVAPEDDLSATLVLHMNADATLDEVLMALDHHAPPAIGEPAVIDVPA